MSDKKNCGGIGKSLLWAGVGSLVVALSFARWRHMAREEERRTQILTKHIMDNVASVTTSAEANGALIPLHTSGGNIPSGLPGIDFELRVLDSLKRKAKAAEERRENTGGVNTKGDSSSSCCGCGSSKAGSEKKEGEEMKNNATKKEKKNEKLGFFNPFLPYEEELFVQNLSPSHLVLLNKFKVRDDHFLVVSRSFIEQTRLLEESDFEAASMCLEDAPVLIFYNGGTLSGASQRHRHLQGFPLPLEKESRLDLPIDALVDAALEGEQTGHLTSVPSLPYLHCVVSIVDCAGMASSEAGRIIASRYRRVIDSLTPLVPNLKELAYAPSPKRVSDTQPFPYNMLLTRKWLMIIPRREEECRGISINAIGFAGGMFVKSEEQVKVLEELTPIGVLSHVAFPPNE